MAAFSHSLMDFLCFDPHTSSNQQRKNSSSPFSGSTTFTNPKFLSSAFFHQSSFSTDNHHDQPLPQDFHHHQQHQQQLHQNYSHPLISSDHHHHHHSGQFIHQFDDPNHHHNSFDQVSKPYSVTHSPEQPMFSMPTFAKGSSNQLSLDGPSYAEPMLNLPYPDHSNRLSSADRSQPTPINPTTDQQPPPLLPTTTSSSSSSTTASVNINHHLPPPSITSQNNSISSQPISKSSNNNSAHAGSSAITPPTTSSSRHASELNMDEFLTTSSDSLAQSKPQSPGPIYGFSQHFKLPENPYSQTGFDLIGALARVVDRPHPKVNIGAVDTSAALVVVDARQNDLPIIFATPSFSVLTGYQTEEIIGQNCRFLQKPFNPNAVKKSNDQVINCPATLQIRSHIQARREIQSSIVNYRKDGKAFFNLVTVIPIAWNTSEISHFVGFQADISAHTSWSTCHS